MQTDSDRRQTSLDSMGSADCRRNRSVQGAERNDSSATVDTDVQLRIDGQKAGTPTDPPYVKLASLTRTRMSSLRQENLTAKRCRYLNDYQTYTSMNGKFTLTSNSWTIEGSGKPICDVRCVLIRGSKNTIINTWAFPHRPDLDPVYAAELIAFGGLPRLAFLDVQVPGMLPERVARVHERVAKTCDEFPELRIEETPPDWAIAATSGNYLFTREGQTSLYDPISAAYLKLLDCYLELVSHAHHADDDPIDFDDSMTRLRDYQTHHMEHSPGTVFLSKLFGESWTVSFMNQFLFSPPGGLA